MDKFYVSKPWLELRSLMIGYWKHAGLPCAYCGHPIEWGKGPTPIVDHILSRRTHPHLELDHTNLQVVHHQCNSYKRARGDRNENRPKPVNEQGFPPDWQ